MSYGTCGLSADVGTSAIRLAVFGGPQRFENFGTGVRELRIFVLSSGKNVPTVCLSPSTSCTKAMSKRVSPPTPDGGGNDLPQCFAGAIDRLMRSLPSTVKAEEDAFLKFSRKHASIGG